MFEVHLYIDILKVQRASKVPIRVWYKIGIVHFANASKVNCPSLSHTNIHAIIKVRILNNYPAPIENREFARYPMSGKRTKPQIGVWTTKPQNGVWTTKTYLPVAVAPWEVVTSMCGPSQLAHWLFTNTMFRKRTLVLAWIYIVLPQTRTHRQKNKTQKKISCNQKKTLYIFLPTCIAEAVPQYPLTPKFLNSTLPPSP